MFTSDSLDALGLAQERARRLRAEATTERLHGTSGRRRRVLAASLRRIADHLDPAPLTRRPAGQS